MRDLPGEVDEEIYELMAENNHVDDADVPPD